MTVSVVSSPPSPVNDIIDCLSLDLGSINL